MTERWNWNLGLFYLNLKAELFFTWVSISFPSLKDCSFLKETNGAPYHPRQHRERTKPSKSEMLALTCLCSCNAHPHPHEHPKVMSAFSHPFLAPHTSWVPTVDRQWASILQPQSRVQTSNSCGTQKRYRLCCRKSNCLLDWSNHSQDIITLDCRETVFQI